MCISGYRVCGSFGHLIIICQCMHFVFGCVGFSMLVLLFINVWLWMAPSRATIRQLAKP